MKQGLRRGRCKWCLNIFFYPAKSKGFPKYCCADHKHQGILRSNRESHRRNAEKYKPVKKDWNLRNKDKVKLQSHIRHQKMKFRYTILARIWRRKHKEEWSAYMKAWRIAHPEQLAIYKERKRLAYHEKKSFHKNYLDNLNEKNINHSTELLPGRVSGPVPAGVYGEPASAH